MPDADLNMKWLTKNAVLFSVKTCIAAFLSLYIALELNLDKPAWSMVSVYVISQLYSASTLSKATYRFLGTVLGGIFIFLVYPFTVNYPILFSFSVSLWVAFCLYLSLHDRTPRGYAFMLAGYSAAIMGFADVTTPLSITYTVISRVEEITVAIVCSSLIHMLVLPVRMVNVLENSVNNWYESAKNLCIELLTVGSQENALERQHILAQMANYPSNVEALITHCVFEGNSARRLIRLVTAQYQHLSYLIPTLTAIEKRLSLLADQDIGFPDFVAATFQQFLLWLNSPGQSGNARAIQQEIRASQERIKSLYHNGKMNAEESLLFIGLLERLQNFIRIAESYFGVKERVSEFNQDNKGGKPKLIIKKHSDEGLILLSSFSAFVATMVGCLFWIGAGWRDGATAPMMAAVICSFFATLDSPIASIKLFLKGVLIASAISIIYAAIFIPMSVTFESLIICLAPGLLALGLVIANPSTNFIGLIISTQIPGFLGMSHHFKPDMLVMVNAVIATIVGIVVALITTALIRNKRPSWTARRALRKGIKELLQFFNEIKIGAPSLLARQQYVASMLDKVNIILPRNKVDPIHNAALGGNLITEIWLGVNCYDFFARHQGMLKSQALETDALMYEINTYLKDRIKNIHISPPHSLLHELNRLLLQLEMRCRSDMGLFKPLFYLFNIRMSLYPSARWPEA